MPASFRASSFLLTYPQSDFPLQDCLDFLKGKEHMNYVLISSELHETGELHRHALVHFSKVVQLGITAFDFMGRHPNVKTVGRKKSDWENVEQYVKKDGNFLEWGMPRHTASIWAQVAMAASREEAEQLILAEKPRDFIINSRQIDYFLDKKFPPKQTSNFFPRPLDSFVVPDPLTDWLNSNFWYVSCGAQERC